MSAKKNPEAEFAYGFCVPDGYNTKLLHLVIGDNSSCSRATKGAIFDLNYPSFAILLSSFKSFSQVYHQTITNVGSPTSMYKAIVTNTAAGLRIKVNPSVLAFTSVGQKLSFALTIEGMPNKDLISAFLVWDDGKFQVRRPIVVAVSTDD
ncbi:hypothetical protein FH972_001404 [Carpinus fangiana]|uniref:Subtilisin-like protease fibronectin type-III domain-containing protein n=1 Tax=Carpinus fangiana TaxID=176857 RepID=A0A5N6QE95_9ROSI|nr:hypothetical protein FH972_001404 [Carpinus fangiana]